MIFVKMALLLLVGNANNSYMNNSTQKSIKRLSIATLISKLAI